MSKQNILILERSRPKLDERDGTWIETNAGVLNVLKEKEGRHMNDEKEKMVGMMLPESLAAKVQQEATRQERSLSGQVRLILKEWVDSQEGHPHCSKCGIMENVSMPLCIECRR